MYRVAKLVAVTICVSVIVLMLAARSDREEDLARVLPGGDELPGFTATSPGQPKTTGSSARKSVRVVLASGQTKRMLMIDIARYLTAGEASNALVVQDKFATGGKPARVSASGSQIGEEVRSSVAPDGSVKAGYRVVGRHGRVLVTANLVEYPIANVKQAKSRIVPPGEIKLVEDVVAGCLSRAERLGLVQ